MGYYVLSWIAFVIASAAYIVIVYTYFSSIFEMRYSNKITIGACLALALINLAPIFANNAIVNMAVSVLTLGTIIQFFTGGLVNRLIFAVFLLAAGVVSEFLVGYVFISILPITPDDVQFGTPEFVYGLMFSRTLLAIFSRVISAIAKNRKLPKMKAIQLISLIVPPAGSLIVLYNFMYVRAHSLLDMVSSIIVMLMSVIVITIYGKILLDYKVELKNSYLEEILKYFKYQYFLAEKSEKLISKTKHDIKNILIGLQTSIQNQKISGVQKKINTLLGEIDSFDGPAISGNLAIDSIINYKASVARKGGVHFSMDLRVPQELELDAVVICQIIGSALDNAIEATERMESEADKLIQINVNYKHDALFLQITNPYYGDVIVDNMGNLMSSKRSYQTEGIGLQSIASITRENNGVFVVDYKDNQFCLSVTLYNICKSSEEN